MSQVVKYQLVTASTGTAAGLGNVTVVQPGRIKAVVFRWRSAGGAGQGNVSCELTVNQGANSYAETNDPLRTGAVASATYSVANAGTSGGTTAPMLVDTPVKAGDRLYLNQTQSGTAPATVNHIFDVFVQEG